MTERQRGLGWNVIKHKQVLRGGAAESPFLLLLKRMDEGTICATTNDKQTDHIVVVLSQANTPD